MKQDGQGGYSSEIAIPETSKNFSGMSFGFTLNATSAFYTLIEHFDIKLLETLAPRELEQVKVMGDLTTHNSAFITFALPKELEKVSNEMLFDVRMKLTGDAEKWKKIENPRLQLKDGDKVLAIDNLEYANTAYQVKIRMKSKIAKNVDEMWAPYRDVSFVTKPKKPVMLPKTCANCFNLMDNGNVVIYWMEVPKLYRNADGFKYRIRGFGEHENEVIHRDLNETSMMLSNNYSSKSLKIKLYSVNIEGTSDGFSQIDVPLLSLLSSKKLLNIRKELVNQTYKISWMLLEKLEVESFTIFWCRQRSELPNQCDGIINFRQLPSNVSDYVMQATEMSHFGVAANLMNKAVAQGFEWAECTASKANGKLS